MPSVTAVEAMRFARTMLNDEQGNTWTDYRLFPKLRVAYSEMLNKFLTSGLPITNQTSSIMNVPAVTIDDNNLDLSTVAGYPTDMLEPVWMKERALGQANKDFVDMTQVDYVPQVSLSGIQLIWWCWIHGTIMVRGATTIVQVMLRYRRQLAAPKYITDDLIVPLAETYLGPETAYLAMSSIPSPDQTVLMNIKTVAEANLEEIVAQAVNGGLQNLPAKRRPYHRGHGRSRAIRDF